MIIGVLLLLFRCMWLLLCIYGVEYSFVVCVGNVSVIVVMVMVVFYKEKC